LEHTLELNQVSILSAGVSIDIVIGMASDIVLDVSNPNLFLALSITLGHIAK